MNKNRITDVFFDLDHTLWDFDKNSKLTFEEIFKKHNLTVSLNDFVTVYEPINAHYWKLYREDQISKEKLRFGRLYDAFYELSIHVSSDTIHKLATDYITYLSSFNHLLAHTKETLEYLAGRYELHIITNGFTTVQYKKMKNAKIINYFKTITTSEDVGVKKPQRKIFEYALRQANTIALQSVMIGDNLEADILGAQEVGMHTLWLPVNKTPLNITTRTIQNLAEIKQFL